MAIPKVRFAAPTAADSAGMLDLGVASMEPSRRASVERSRRQTLGTFWWPAIGPGVNLQVSRV